MQSIILMERLEGCYDRGLTYASGSIYRGVISLRTLAEVAANSIRAFTHTTKTWYI